MSKAHDLVHSAHLYRGSRGIAVVEGENACDNLISDITKICKEDDRFQIDRTLGSPSRVIFRNGSIIEIKYLSEKCQGLRSDYVWFNENIDQTRDEAVAIRLYNEMGPVNKYFDLTTQQVLHKAESFRNAERRKAHRELAGILAGYSITITCFIAIFTLL